MASVDIKTSVDVARDTIDTTSRLWNYMLALQLEGKLNKLETAMDQLKNHKDVLMSRVDAEESLLWKRIPAVDGWLKNFAALEMQVADVLKEGELVLDRSCLCGLLPWNCWNSHLFRDKVISKISLVEKLKEEGVFPVVTETPGPSRIHKRYEIPTTFGLGAKLEESWKSLLDDKVGVIGLCGLGGVGKTTLLGEINNKFLETDEGFDMVMYVVISREVNMHRVQGEIGDRLGFSWPESKDMISRARDIFKVLSGKRFVLLLDDIWEQIDLSSIGIPLYEPKFKSKIVITTRSAEVCGWMGAKEIRVECLTWDDSWGLFQSIVGRNSHSNPQICELAKKVAKECGGLPLALIVIGRTMVAKTTPEEWKHAITILQKNAAEFPHMEDKIFSILKYSYDNLRKESYRFCFLFCSLYPEDYEISVEILVEQWIGKGYIGEFDTSLEAVNSGHDTVGILKAASLLESVDKVGYKVKMHDVVRDLAHWIACECGRQQGNVLVSTGSGVSISPKVEKWVKAESVSLMCTDIAHLGNTPIADCPNLSTVILSGNGSLKHIPGDFFRFMPALTFLDISKAAVTVLPTSIGELVLLEYLDLSDTQILELPCEVKNLSNLKYFFLKSKQHLPKIPGGVIKDLSKLEVLKLSDGHFGEGEDVRLAGIEELGCLNKLISLEIVITNDRVHKVYLSKSQLVSCTKVLSRA